MRTISATVAALAAFAGNSLLCRVALAGAHIDAASFTFVRIASGALVLAILVGLRSRPRPEHAGDWPSALALVLYAAPFSFAYLRVDAGVGALVLFASVQATMLGWAIARGERPPGVVWLGLAIAIAGLVGLTLPGLDRVGAPDPIGALAMIGAGIGWGAYSLRGRGSKGDPLPATAGNFVRSVPLVLAIAGVYAMTNAIRADATGVTLAIVSGAVTSGLGYTIWYAALRGLTAMQASIVQLVVPVVAAAGGIVLLDERPTTRLLVAGGAIVLGVAIAIRGRAVSRP
jgi:drug/metabolite transporter (DMT)-like permease